MLADDESAEKPTEKAKWFTTTHWSVVLAAGQGGSPQAQAALEKLCSTYWYPLYAYVRRQGHGPHDAQDLVQGFFERLLQTHHLQTANREKGKFRSFLLTMLNHYLSDQRDRTEAAKRGGGKTFFSLNADVGEGLLFQEPASSLPPEREFEKRWASALLQAALLRVRGEYEQTGKHAIFEGLKPFLEGEARPGEYAQFGQRLGMSASAVAVAVHRLRQRYREAVRTEIANTVTSFDEIEEEMRHLFAVLGG
jgi:RNA polymerase sigma factor (sigma-70 family)